MSLLPEQSGSREELLDSLRATPPRWKPEPGKPPRLTQVP
jgi:hypothetical protein